MAQYYKVDNRLLNEDEYKEYCVSVWAVCLFIGSAIFCGYHLHGMIPAEWEKEMRFAALVIPSVIAGIIAVKFAGFIRGAFFVGLALVVVYVTVVWVWNVV